MRLTTLGTSCAQQTATRCQSAFALSLHAGCTYLFDCGSSTNGQLIRAGIRHSTIHKVFITHLHADHVCGLPGLLCDILGGHGGTPAERRQPTRRRTVDVYGPKGIAELLRASWRLTFVALADTVRIHELLFEGEPADTSEPYANELPLVSQTIWESGAWTGIAHDDACTVSAVPIKHSVPCFGYILTEDSHVKLSRTIVDTVTDAHGRGTAAFAQAIKALKSGHPLPELGIDAQEVRRGREVVLLGDTCDASAVLPHVSHPSLLLHESTNAYIPELARPDETAEGVRERAISRGHATPEMAGELADRMGVQTLVLTHFSSRYAGDVRGKKVMRHFEEIARGRCPKAKVIAAWDGMYVDVP